MKLQPKTNLNDGIKKVVEWIDRNKEASQNNHGTMYTLNNF